MRLKKPAVGALALVGLVAGGAVAAFFLHPPDYPPRPGFVLPDLSGTPRDIAEFDGQILVLNFWATWCVPCRKEIPMLIEAQADYAEEGVQIIGIAADTRAAAAAFAKKYGINYTILADPRDAARVQDAYTAEGDPAAVLPYTVVVDRKGRIRAQIAGKLNRARFDDLVAPLLDAEEAA